MMPQSGRERRETLMADRLQKGAMLLGINDLTPGSLSGPESGDNEQANTQFQKNLLGNEAFYNQLIELNNWKIAMKQAKDKMGLFGFFMQDKMVSYKYDSVKGTNSNLAKRDEKLQKY